jgi:hypothetical protein
MPGGRILPPPRTASPAKHGLTGNDVAMDLGVSPQRIAQLTRTSGSGF